MSQLFLKPFSQLSKVITCNQSNITFTYYFYYEPVIDHLTVVKICLYYTHWLIIEYNNLEESSPTHCVA